MGTSSLVEGTSSHVEETSVWTRPLPPPTAASELSGNAPPKEGETEAEVTRKFSNQIDALMSKADELEKKVKDVTDFFENKRLPNSSKGNSWCLKNKIDGGRKEVACSRRMHEVMRQFGTIFKQLSQHKWAWPFMDPVDVKGLDLPDYYEIVKKPMDFTTIKKQMDANVYTNVREIYADVRLVFSNAMTYNKDTRSDVHVMAKTLLDKVEEKWLQLLPKVIEAETQQKEEEEVALATMQITQEAAIGKLASDTNNELNKLNLQLEELRELVVRRCRKMSLDEKRKLSTGIMSLNPDYLYKAVEIIGQSNPTHQAPIDVVEIDIDAQNEITLWRLKFFVKWALESQVKSSAPKANIHEKLESQPKRSVPKARIHGALEGQAKNYVAKAKIQTGEVDNTSKRKKMIYEGNKGIYDAYERHKVIYDALAQTARKRSK